jgi:hypothetical protein
VFHAADNPESLRRYSYPSHILGIEDKVMSVVQGADTSGPVASAPRSVPVCAFSDIFSGLTLRCPLLMLHVFKHFAQGHNALFARRPGGEYLVVQHRLAVE